MKVLIISGQNAHVKPIGAELRAIGLEVDSAENDADGDSKTRAGDYDVVILDHGKGDEEMFLAKWREDGVTAHVLVLLDESATAEARAHCLNQGADVVLNKPVNATELQARLCALTRRKFVVPSSVLRLHDLEIDVEQRTVRRADRVIPLTPREYELLNFLVARRGKTVSRQVIHEQLFSSNGRRNSNVVDVYIRYLRRKIDEGFPLPLILTRWGTGYEFRDDRAMS